MRESSIELRAVALLKAAGVEALKVGFDGWPDRLVLWAPGRHFWLEFKTPKGRLTPAQKVRIPRLVAAGEEVFIVTSAEEVLALIVGRPK